jgi:thioredoxin-dependent peroxiredoxin
MKRIAAFLFCVLSACGATQRPDGGRGLLAEGDEAPDFMAADQSGQVRHFNALRGGHVAVLFFYPRDGTPGCTAEACAFRDAWDRLQGAGAVVIGVSTDSSEAHAHFAQEHDLQFPLLADTEGRVLRLYGVPETLGMAARVTYLIDTNGHVAHVYPDVDPAVHVDEVITAIGELSTPE